MGEEERSSHSSDWTTARPDTQISRNIPHRDIKPQINGIAKIVCLEFLRTWKDAGIPNIDTLRGDDDQRL